MSENQPWWHAGAGLGGMRPGFIKKVTGAAADDTDAI